MKSRNLSSVLLILVSLLAFVAVPPASAESGQFEGQTDHEASGKVSIVKTETGFELQLGEDFEFDGAPAPRLAFGKDGYRKETLFAALKKNTGAQTYPLPRSFNPENYNEVWLWCTKYDVALGVAKLKAD